MNEAYSKFSSTVGAVDTVDSIFQQAELPTIQT